MKKIIEMLKSDNEELSNLGIVMMLSHLGKDPLKYETGAGSRQLFGTRVSKTYMDRLLVVGEKTLIVYRDIALIWPTNSIGWMTISSWYRVEHFRGQISILEDYSGIEGEWVKYCHTISNALYGDT